MAHLLLTVMFFALASALNTADQVLEARFGFLRRRFGGRVAWAIHLAFITPGWIAFFVLASGVGEPLRWPLPEGAWVMGPPVLAVGLVLSGSALVQLGPVATLNGRVFGVGRREVVEGGIFAWLDNPMYDGFALIFVGSGFWATNSAHLVLAAASYVILNLCEARVENRLHGGAGDIGLGHGRPERP